MAQKTDSEYNPGALMNAATSKHLSDPQSCSFCAPEFHESDRGLGHVDSAHAPSSQIELRYQGLLTDPRFFQFANIPNRIIRCLHFYGIDGDMERVRSVLLAYYLFIALADDLIDGSLCGIGDDILARFGNPFVCLNEDAVCSDAEFLAELLKMHFPASSSAVLRRKLRALYRINFQERRAGTMRAFVETRRLLGAETADISFLLIRDHLAGDALQVRKLMRQVGAVGCLVDSIVDARDDRRAGLLWFRPSFIDWLFLYAQTFALGAKIGLRHPRLIALFADAIADNIRDRRRPSGLITRSEAHETEWD